MSPRLIYMRASKPPYRGRVPGFELVELLVILVIILLLIAILLPALARARQRAKSAVCLANMAGIARASLSYAADDPSEQLIPVSDPKALKELSGTFEWGGKAGAGQPAIAGRIETSVFGTDAYRGPAHRPLNRYIYKAGFKDWNPFGGQAQPGEGASNYVEDAKLDLPIFHCPADSGYAGGGFLYTGSSRYDRQEKAFRDERLSAYDHYGVSYAASTLWITGGSAGKAIKSRSLYFTPVSRVPSPSTTVAYLEVPARFAWIWGSWKNSGCEWAGYERRVEGGDKAIPGWHGSNFSFNLAFTDGHGRFVEMKGCARPANELPKTGYPAGCDPSVDPYECARCVTVRSPDTQPRFAWQLDTFPAPPVLTEWADDRSSPPSASLELLP